MPDCLVVWNRRGVVVAWRRAQRHGESDGKAFSKSLREQIEKLASLNREGEGEAYVKALSTSDARNSSVPSTALLNRGSDLLLQVASLRTKAAQSDGKVLRLLLETSTFNDVAASLHDLHQQRVLATSAAEAERNVRAIRDTQEKVEWVEIFLVGVYSVCLIHYLGENFSLNGYYVGGWIIGGTLFASFIAWRLLRPGKHDHLTSGNLGEKGKRGKAIYLLASILILLAVYVTVGKMKFPKLSENVENNTAKKTGVKP
jgi:hypothetical protein